MQEETIGSWLEALASSAPAPGGGAAAALEVAVGAALVEMVCNLTIGKPAYAEHEEALIAIRDRATVRRSEGIRLAGEDAAAFSAVMDAYKLPKATDEETAERKARIQATLADAADVPRRAALAAEEILELAESALPGANVNVISDLAAAAASARAALQTALVNIDANRSLIDDPATVESLAAAAREIDLGLVRADAILAAVRDRING